MSSVRALSVDILDSSSLFKVLTEISSSIKTGGNSLKAILPKQKAHCNYRGNGNVVKNAVFSYHYEFDTSLIYMDCTGTDGYRRIIVSKIDDNFATPTVGCFLKLQEEGTGAWYNFEIYE